MKRNPSIIKSAVLKMGGTIEEFIPERGCFYISIFGKRILLERKISISRHSFVSGQLTRCKDITYKLLKDNGLPTPKTETFYKKSYDKDLAEKQMESLNYPVILKDAQGSQSKGVFPFIGNVRDAMVVLEEELEHYRGMIAQEMVFGKEYRILVLDEKVIGALEMIPAFAVGDGVSTIRDIMEAKQRPKEKKTEFDEKLEQLLEQQNFTLESIMPKNDIAYIRKIENFGDDWQARDVTDEVHPSIEKICVAASKVVGKYLVGIDVMCEDVSKDPSVQSFNIIEINGKPDLYIHYDPTHGQTRDVVGDIVRFMAEKA